MSKTALMVCLLLAYLICVSCRQQTVKKKHLHNYPIIEGQDCPNLIISRDRYNPTETAKEAAILNMRPVDYLHVINNKRYKPLRKPGEITKIGDYKLK
jgi:hypothetical protein